MRRSTDKNEIKNKNKNKNDNQTASADVDSDARRIEQRRAATEQFFSAGEKRMDLALTLVIEICDADYRSFSLPCDALEGEGGETLKEPSRPYGMCTVSLPASGCSDCPARLCIQ
ncbi:MAG: hypothetical protein GY878_06225 [Fuerstiella sp.]|nr:hypothetical protein [Fuerstiella sp.]